MSTIAAIQVGRQQLGLDEDTYRLMLVRVTGGKDSLRAMSEDERKRVLAEMRRQGFKDAPRKAPGAANLSGTYGKVGRALWLTGWNLGVFHDRTDAALLSFVERQTGISHLSWVRDPAEGKKVMEALKAWISRRTGLVWPTETYARKRGKSVARARKEAVHEIQHRILGETWTLVSPDVTDEALDQRIAAMGKRVRAVQSPPKKKAA